MKTIKIEDNLHERFEAYALKSESYAQAFVRLFSEAPYTKELEETVRKTIEVVEAGKRSGHMSGIVADDLTRAVQRFVQHVHERNR